MCKWYEVLNFYYLLLLLLYLLLDVVFVNWFRQAVMTSGAIFKIKLFLVYRPFLSTGFKWIILRYSSRHSIDITPCLTLYLLVSQPKS
jgi:hypothetical protein